MGREDNPGWEVGQSRKHRSIILSISGAHVCGGGGKVPSISAPIYSQVERGARRQLTHTVSASLLGKVAKGFQRASEWQRSNSLLVLLLRRLKITPPAPHRQGHCQHLNSSSRLRVWYALKLPSSGVLVLPSSKVAAASSPQPQAYAALQPA